MTHKIWFNIKRLYYSFKGFPHNNGTGFMRCQPYIVLNGYRLPIKFVPEDFKYKYVLPTTLPAFSFKEIGDMSVQESRTLL